MRKSIFLLLFGVALVGCHIDTETPKAAGPTDVPAPTKPVKNSAPIPEKPSGQPLNVKHKDRIYQLADLRVEKLKANGQTIDAWVMDTDGMRNEGMMFLKKEDVPDNQGMIFVFPAEQDKGRGFWMQNTYIPLDIVYIGKDKKVVDMVKGKALDEANLPSAGAFMYVLELKEGMAAKLGIKKGTLVEIPGSIRANE